MGPELALAIDTCATESSALVITIIKKVGEVRKFKSKCVKLGKDALVIQQLLGKNKSAIESLQTLADIQGCLYRIQSFVDSCTSYNVLNVTYEVFVKRTYTALRKEVYALREIFLFESVNEILSREDAHFKSINDKQNTILQDQRSMLKQSRCDFILDDSCDIKFDYGASNGRGCINGVGAVVCYQIPTLSFTQKNLEVYRNIQAGAYVQRLYGTLEVNSRYYAVMEDLEGGTTLARACHGGALPRTMLERIGLAYDLAKTMAWYHKAELLLRSITDTTVILRELSSGKICPFLTRLHNSRHFVAVTSGVACDARYEAPEYRAVPMVRREHSKYTDIWNLGTIIWQCVFGKSPYGIRDEVLPESKRFSDDCEKIDDTLRRGLLPGALNKRNEPPGLSDIIRQCWKANPMLRPTAAAVAQMLLDIIASLSFPIATQESDNGDALSGITSCEVEESRTRALKAIQEARKLNENSPILVQSTLKVTAADFDLFLDDDDEPGPFVSFIIGAIIFWNLVEDFSDKESESPLSSTAMSMDGKRARLALTYLERAAQRGYNEAYLEMYKAYAILAREFETLKELFAVKEATTFAKAKEGFLDTI